jgi:PAS domain S-box-containing protein
MARKTSLSRLVAATLVGVTTLLLVALGIVGYRSEAKAQRASLLGLSRVQADQLAVALAVPVWNIDRQQIDKIVEAMSQPHSIYGISVQAAGETYGRARDAQWQLARWNGAGAPPGLIVEQRTVVFEGHPVGIVRLYVTPQFMQDDLRLLLVKLIAAILLVDLLIIVSVYLVLWRSVLRPLTGIERYADAVSAGARGAVAPASAGSAAELESLRSSIASMVSLLELREERFVSIFDAVNDAIFILDSTSGAILDVNARTCEMFGYTREEAKAIFLGALSSGTPPYTHESAVAVITKLRPGDQQLVEWRARHKDGRLFWVEVSLRAAMLGGMPRVVSVVRDIDERKAMQEALQRSETMSMIGSLVAGVAHEVRNPLFGISAALDAFEAELGSSDDVAEYLATLRNDVSRLSRLMNDLLDYGRPRRLDRHPQSLQPVIDEAVRVCAPRARAKQIEIRQEIDPHLPAVSIDGERMLQVLRNVIENAVELSPSGQPVLLRVRPSATDAASVVCTVTDRGPGFRAEDLPHVFEPFFTRRAGGSGLGLAIVQKIVSEHGGTISARNAGEGGGVVEVRLPVR